MWRKLSRPTIALVSWFECWTALKGIPWARTWAIHMRIRVLNGPERHSAGGCTGEPRTAW
eukprot:3764438-Pyramimonas_sp.AAC.1